jgi:RNA polymerase sigma-70 factor, ECF subfamily
MNPKRASDGQEESTSTLGDLLYADRSCTSIPEPDWVRLVQSIAAGDQQALRALYERTNRIVFTLVMRICGNREMAEELTLDVFHDVWRRSGRYDPKAGSVVGWIMMQARSRAIDRLRFERRKKRIDPHPAPDRDDEQVDATGPANVVAARQRRDLLQAALTALTADERQTIETAFFSELTYSETAVRLDQPIGTVKTRVRSALAKLRKALRSEGGRP